MDSTPHSRSVAEARLSSVLDTAVDGIIVIDEEARILVFNKACERLFGYSAGEMIGRNVETIMPPEYAGEHVGKIIGAGREVKGRRRDGTIFPIELSLGESMTPEGRQFVGILRDLRRRKETEQRLVQLQGELLHMARVSAMDEMGAALAHELNQPLTALMLYLQAVLRAAEKRGSDDPFSAQTLGILEKSVNEAERAGNIVQRMRSFVEKREPARQLVELVPLIEDALELTLLASRRGTQIVRNFTTDLPQVIVDPVQIQQVIVGLVRNAIDATKALASPEIRVSALRRDSKVEIQVEDNGPGIPAEAVPDLFKAFASSESGGRGPGLAIARTIAQNHGGDLTVDPGGNGCGARFTLHLPLPEASDM